MDKVWRLKVKREKEKTLLESILSSKGIVNPEDIKEFLSDKPQLTYDPFIIKSMDKAVEKIKKHIEYGNKIVIFGDYDVDGIASTALLVEFIGILTNNINYYIPNRFSEGYGLNKEAIRYIKKELEGQLIITVDNGVSSHDEVEYAKELGMDIIITDHHNPPDILPKCILINTKQKDDNYPFKDLCGCGIAFKLIQALQREFNISRKYLNRALDLVALATIADLVPLLDENRTITKYGLKSINANNRIGLLALREELGLKDRYINAGTIGFTIAPCFNATGRIEDARLGVKLLLETDLTKARIMGETLVKMNNTRKDIQEKGESHCMELAGKKYLNDDFLVLDGGNISEGVIGIIAGRIKDAFYKPTLVITRGEEGYLKGSGRSISGINIYDEMKKVSDLLISFGGHEMACGFSIDEDRVKELRERLNNQAKEIRKKDPEIFKPKVDIVTEANVEELSIDIINSLSKLEPYGVGNPKPLFILKNIEVNNNWTRACGSDNSHLKFSGKKNNIFVNGIGFSLAKKYYSLKSPNKVHLAFYTDINEYKGEKRPQLIIEDLSPA